MTTIHMPGCGKPITYRVSTRERRRSRRVLRLHARMLVAAGCSEKAAVWLKRVRNG